MSSGRLSRGMEQYEAVTVRALWMYLLLMTIARKSSADLADETTTLLGLKQAWGNPSTLSNWSTDTANYTCSWTGVVCDPSNNTVFELRLDGNLLYGRIPDTIGNLTGLQLLDLSNNSFTESIPETLGSLGATLMTLYLNKNNLTGHIPDTIGNLTGLQQLALSQNSLNGAIPETLGSLGVTLMTLYLNQNSLTGHIPDTIGNLTGLQLLDLSYNSFTKSIPETLGSLGATLMTLNLYENSLTGHIPDTIGNLTGLQQLALSQNSLNGAIPETLGSLGVTLMTLYLNQNNLTGHIPDTIGNLTGLQQLYLNENNLTGHIPDTIGNLTGLQLLDLNRNSFTGSIPETLGSLGVNLMTLDCGYNSLDGPIPLALANLTLLNYLSLANNNLTGNIPPQLGQLSNLGILFDLSMNKLEGPIPEQLGNFSKVRSLLLDQNSLTGHMPAQLAGLANVIYLSQKLTRFKIYDHSHFYTNQLSGPIPRELGQLSSVQSFDLRINRFNGSIPNTIQNLTALLDLWLSDNLLSGNIPLNFTAIPNFRSLRVANNNLSGPISISTHFQTQSPILQLEFAGNFFTGEVPDSLLSMHPVLQTLSIQDNCLNGTFPQALVNPTVLQFLDIGSNCFNGTVCNAKCVFKVKGKGNKSAKNISITTGVVAGLLSVVGLGVFLIVRKRKRRYEAITRTYQVPASIRRYTLMEVIGATENYTKKIGEGGFSTVYKADFKDGIVAAVKHFNKKRPEENFGQEVEFLANLNHRYLVNMIGYCEDQGELMLLYDFMDRGSLFDALHGSSSDTPLTWDERVRILLHIARGIDYLHYGAPTPLIHRDIKSANILLASSNDKSLQAKLADFGLGKQTILDSNEAMSIVASDELPKATLTRIAGTPGYIDPEYMIAAHLSPKSDVFSYGIVVLELVTGKQAIFLHNQARIALVQWAKPYLEGNQIVTILDPKLGNESIPEAELVSVAELVLRCIDNDSRNRPTIRGVLKTLSNTFRPESETRAFFSGELASTASQRKDVALRLEKSLFSTGSFEISGSRDSCRNNYTLSEILPRD